MSDTQKLQVVEILCEYIEKFASKAQGSGAFEKSRESQHDRQQKLKIIAKYNEKLERFTRDYLAEFDMSIVADLV